LIITVSTQVIIYTVLYLENTCISTFPSYICTFV